MAVQAADFVKLIRDRLIELMPFGLYRIWFCVKGGSIRLLAMVLGYSERTMLAILRIPPFARRNGDYLVENWSTILELPVERRAHAKVIHVRFGPLQVSRREVQSLEEVRMRQEAENTSPIDQRQDRFCTEFFEAVCARRGMIRDRRLSGDMQRWLAEQWEVWDNKIAALEVESDDETVSDEPNSECFMTPETDLQPRYLRVFNSLREEEQRDIVEYWLSMHAGDLEHITVRQPNNQVLNWFRVPGSRNTHVPGARD